MSKIKVQMKSKDQMEIFIKKSALALSYFDIHLTFGFWHLELDSLEFPQCGSGSFFLF
jgi:hypothetical protein